MALTKIGKEGITGVSNAANATFLTATSAEGVTLAGTLAVTGVHTVGTNAVATSEGGAETTSVVQGLVKCWARVTGTGSGAPAADSFNVGSTTDSGTGDYEVAYTNDFTDGEYCITLGDSTNANVASGTHTRCNTSSAGGHGLQVYYNGALADAASVFCQVTGDLA